MRFNRTSQTAMATFAAVLGIAEAAPPAGAPAPDFVLKSLDDRNIRLSEYRGDVVMLSFWATWCGDCSAQLETLDELRVLYGDDGLALVAVSLDSDRRNVAKAVRSMSVGFPVLHDAGGEVGRLYDIGSMPTTILIDRDGAVRSIYEGRRGSDESQYAADVQKLLREY